MTSPIYPRPPIRSNVENRSIVSRSTVTIELVEKHIEQVNFTPETLVQNEGKISSIIFNFTMLHRVHTYENLTGIHQKIGGKILSSSNQGELFSYSESNKVETESQLTVDLSSKNVTDVFFEARRSCLNANGTTSLEFRFTTESRVCKQPICKTLEDGCQKKEKVVDENSEQIPSSSYVKMNPKKSSIYGTFSQQLSNELPSALEKDLVTEDPIYEELKTASANSEQISSDREKDSMENTLARSIHKNLSHTPFRLAFIPEENLSDEELIYEILKAADESSEQISSDGEKDSTKNTLTRSTSDMHFPDDKTAKKSKNWMKRLIELFGKCIARNPQNNVLIKPFEYSIEMQKSPIYDKTKFQRTISEDSGYITPLSSPGSNYSAINPGLGC